MIMSIYKQYCEEFFDEAGLLKKFSLKYPDNFNFGYDVVDRIADETPDKRALVWCNVEGEEHVFSFGDIKRYSNRIANTFRKRGIGRGDRVMLILKRHYEYWFAAIALHKLGAVVIPATHMLMVSDLVYRIKTAKVKAIVYTSQNEIPEKVLAAVKELNADIKLFSVQEEKTGFERNLNGRRRLQRIR